MRAIVEEGVQEAVGLLAEFNAISDRFAEPMSDDEMTALIEQQGKVQEKIDHLGAWDIDARLEMAMDALRARRRKLLSKTFPAAKDAAWRCAAAASETENPPLDEPTNPPGRGKRSPGWSSTCSTYAGTVIAVTHDRYFLDNVAGWILELDRGAAPLEGQLFSWLEQKQSR